jgi:folate-dependent phosphoribosylglycinamide formyltransferase PurN
MKIFIATMDEPFYMNLFIAKVLESRKDDIIGLVTSKGTRLTTKRGRFDPSYAITLCVIMGLKNSIKKILYTINFKIKKKLSRFLLFIESPSITQKAKHLGIPTWEVESVNDDKFIDMLETLKPDVIINQTQEILNKRFIGVPPKGVLNRHASLLPRNRGRLTPFWILLNGEKETGVSIHFVTPKIDQGDIIVQRKIIVDDDDDFSSLVQKGYDIVPDLMLEALEKIEKGSYDVIFNDPDKASYNSIPTLMDALRYRIALNKK